MINVLQSIFPGGAFKFDSSFWYSVLVSRTLIIHGEDNILSDSLQCFLVEIIRDVNFNYDGFYMAISAIWGHDNKYFHLSCCMWMYVIAWIRKPLTSKHIKVIPNVRHAIRNEDNANVNQRESLSRKLNSLESLVIL